MGVWEDGDFRACLVFTRPPAEMATRFGLARQEVVELARYARRGLESPFSQVFSQALVLLREHNPEARMLVAILEDPYRGVILQASGWACLGRYFPGAGSRLSYALPLDRKALVLLEGLTTPYPHEQGVAHAV